MSRSSPGRYALHEFAKNIYSVKATDGEGHPLEITRSDPYSWNISGHKGTVVVQYTCSATARTGHMTASIPRTRT